MDEKKKYLQTPEGQLRDLTGKALRLLVVRYASRFLGLVRTMVIAAVFGASVNVDVFYGTFGAVLIFFEIIPFAFSQAFVPLYTRYIIEKRFKELSSISLSYMFTGAFFLLGCFLLLSALAEPIITKIYVFSDPESPMVELGVVLFRYSLLVMLLNFFVGNFSAILYAKEQVVVPSLINLLKNIIIIVSIVTLNGRIGIVSIAVGFTLGSLVQMFYLAWMAIRSGWRVHLPDKIPFKAIGYMWRLFIPAFLGLAVAQINIIVDRYFTSSLHNDGEVAILTYANILISLITVFATSLTIAIFPKYSHQVTRYEIGELKDMLNRALRALFFFVFPIMALVMLVSSPLVSLIFNLGEFKSDPESVQKLGLLVSLFRIFCIWVVFYSINNQLFMVIFSFRDTVTPMFVAAFNVGCNILFNWLFTKVFSFGVHGIVMSTAVSVVITTGLLLIIVYPRIGRVFDSRILKGAAKIIMACMPLVAVIIAFNLIARGEWMYHYTAEAFKDIAYLLAATILGLVAYGWASLRVNRDLTLYFFRNWRAFLGISNRR